MESPFSNTRESFIGNVFECLEFLNINTYQEQKISLTKSYLSWKCIAIYTVLRTKLIMQAIVYVYLMKSITIRQRTTGYVHWCLHAIIIGDGIIAGSKYNTMPCIGNQTTYLEKNKKQINLKIEFICNYQRNKGKENCLLYVYLYVMFLSLDRIIGAEVLN